MYYRALRGALIAAQTIGPKDLEDLAGERTEAIRALLVDELGIDGSRVEVLEPAAVKKPSGDRWVRLELEAAVHD
jgi:hypothetical protein